MPCVLLVCLASVQPLAAAEPAGKVLVLGDSLSAAYGIPKSAGWVALLEDRLQARGFPYEVVNISVSGETTAGGARRLPQALAEHRPRLVLLELGANDGLRALSLSQMQANLLAMVEASQASGARVLLLEMRIPTNYGQRYSSAFRASFRTVSEQTGAVLVPFFLDAIATDPGAFQEDGIHPEAEAQGHLLDAIWPYLQPLLD